MNATPKPVTPQKVRAVLRKAGLIAAKWHRSRMIPGWGEWMPGYRVQDLSTGIVVTYRHSSAEAAERNLERCREALVAAGIGCSAASPHGERVVQILKVT